MPGFSFHFQAAALPYSHDFSNTLWHNFISHISVKNHPEVFHEILQTFFFQRTVGKFLSQISNFCSEKSPAIKDFLHYAGVPCFFALSFLAGDAAQVISPALFDTGGSRYFIRLQQRWGLSFQEEGKRPVGNASMEELAPIMPTLQRILRRKNSILLLTADMKMAIPL